MDIYSVDYAESLENKKKIQKQNIIQTYSSFP